MLRAEHVAISGIGSRHEGCDMSSVSGQLKCEVGLIECFDTVGWRWEQQPEKPYSMCLQKCKCKTKFSNKNIRSVFSADLQHNVSHHTWDHHCEMFCSYSSKSWQKMVLLCANVSRKKESVQKKVLQLSARKIWTKNIAIAHAVLRNKGITVLDAILTRMWANAQRHGRPAEYRWHPLFNAAKFGWRQLLECSAVTLDLSFFGRLR